MRDPRLEKLADVLVNYSVGVKKDNVVRINAPPIAMPLVGEVYRKVLAAGGHPLVRMNPRSSARSSTATPARSSSST
jgi:aminopeptidase